MKRDIILPTTPVIGTADEALMDVQKSFERFCLAAGMESKPTPRTALFGGG